MKPTIKNILLLPFAGLYAFGIFIRNLLYKKGFYKSTSFDVPVISVGNLTTGGTGKTPHIEYLIRLLKPNYPVATLSRGYRRKTHGYLEANAQSTAQDVGDEPLLFKWKYPDVKVSVGEDRVTAIPEVQRNRPLNQVVLLDDAFQHRAVKPGLSLLLTEYNNLFTDDFLLPAGNLREFKNGYKRADIIIVTKAPANISNEEKQAIIAKINPTHYQYVFFSYLVYGNIYPFLQNASFEFQVSNFDCLMLTGIAKPKPLQQHLEQQFKSVHPRNFGDHHNFTTADLESIETTFKAIKNQHKCIVTTEKDATRLYPHKAWFVERKMPVFIQPIVVNVVANDKPTFDKAIQFFVEKTLEENELL